MIISLLVFLLILSVLVLIHELGHFLVAKKFGIKVEEFGYGLPPRAWGKKIGETIYSINWLPIGGFVKLYGEDEAGAGRIGRSEVKKAKNKKDEDRAFYTRPAWQRAAVVVAGVVMNLLLAIVIYYIFMFLSNFKTELPLLSEHKFYGTNQSVKEDIYINEVAKDSPASRAGISQYDKLLTINGQKIRGVDYFTDQIRANKGQEIALSWQNMKTGKINSARVTPRVNPPKNQGALGISFIPMRVAVLSYDTPSQRVFSGITHPMNLALYNFNIMGKLIGVSVKERSAEPIGGAVSGPVGIFKVVEEFVGIPDAKERFAQILNLAGLLSVSLAIFNILPIPALDGGRFFFILFELITGKKVNQKFESAAHSIGMAILLGLILLITFKDVFQFILPQ